MTHHTLTPQRAGHDRLKAPAEEERQITEHHPQSTWPQTVERAYHLGKATAFEQAVHITEQGAEQ